MARNSKYIIAFENIRSLGASKLFLTAIICDAIKNIFWFISGIYDLIKSNMDKAAPLSENIISSIFLIGNTICSLLLCFGLMKAYLYYSGRQPKNGLGLFFKFFTAQAIFLCIIVAFFNNGAYISSLPIFMIYLFAVFICALIVYFTYKNIMIAVDSESGRASGKMSVMLIVMNIIAIVDVIFQLTQSSVFDHASYDSTAIWITESVLDLFVNIPYLISLISFLIIQYRLRSDLLAGRNKFKKSEKRKAREFLKKR